MMFLQQLSLKHPVVRAKLGLPDKDNSSPATDSAGTSTPAITASRKPEIQQEVSVEDLSFQQEVSVEDLSPKELISVSGLEI